MRRRSGNRAGLPQKCRQYLTVLDAFGTPRRNVRPAWIADDRFWYSTTGERGAEIWLVDAAKATKIACELEVCKTNSNPSSPASPRLGATSPDGKKTAFIRNWNLWIRETGTGKKLN